MRAPFPWFGGKSRVADLVWARFGEVRNYVEPFFGSGAVLLARPHEPQIETANDKDGFVCNFFRATQHAPDEVAHYANWPVNECDLHARHVYLCERREQLSRRLEGDPDYYDAKVAGFWCWGLCCWIGAGWCDEKATGPWSVIDGQLVLCDTGRGVHRKLVHLGDAGQGVHRKRVHLEEVFTRLSSRLRRVRVCCGDWERVCGPTPTVKHGSTAVFFDPPYSSEADRDMSCYAVEDGEVAHRVRGWCLTHGSNRLLRIALCGYEGEGHEALEEAGWTVTAWKAHGGYGTQSDNNNKHRERIWFSPNCLPAQQSPLF